MIQYYPNGEIYTLKKYSDKSHPALIYGDKSYPVNNKPSLIECRDSTGKVLAENGNGKWIEFDEEFKNFYEEGLISEGQKNGRWTRVIAGKKSEIEYTNGIVTNQLDYDSTGEIHIKVDISPEFNGGMDKFYSLLSRNIRYPTEERDNNIQGVVFINFVVELDGTLNNLKIIKAPSKNIGMEVLRVVKLSPPWKPGSIKGALVRTSYTIPVKFTLSGNN